MSSQEKTDLVTRLRAQIAALETPPQFEREIQFTLGLEAVDMRLPGGGLSRHGVHEVMAAAYGDMGAAIGFAAALAARACYAADRCDGLIVWCQQGWGSYDLGELYGPGLAAFGLDPTRLLLVNPAREPDMLWALEECVRAGVFAAVVGEVSADSRHFNLRASRRLHLGAEDAGTPLILLRGHAANKEDVLSPSAALTRWQVAAAPTVQDAYVAETASWQVELEKCKGGAPFSTSLAWKGAAQAFVETGSGKSRHSVMPQDRSVTDVPYGASAMRETG